MRNSEARKDINKAAFRLIARKERAKSEREFNSDRQALAIAWQTDHPYLAEIANFLQISRRLIKVKTLRQATAVAVLSLTLAVSVMAGQTDTTGAVAPPPPPTSSSTQTTGTAVTILLTVLSLIYR